MSDNAETNTKTCLPNAPSGLAACLAGLTYQEAMHWLAGLSTQNNQAPADAD